MGWTLCKHTFVCDVVGGNHSGGREDIWIPALVYSFSGSFIRDTGD